MFRPLGLSSLLAALLCASACKSKSQEPAPAPATPPAPASARAPELPPIADDTLSLAQVAGATCRWVRLDAARGTRRDVFSFEGACETAQLAWSQEGRQGAVLQTFGQERPPRAWTVDLATGQGTALPLPDVGRATALGFDAEGRALVLVAHFDGEGMKPPERTETDGQAAFVFEGKKYPVALQDGTFGLAHAFRREGGAWKRQETRVASYDMEGATETRELALARQLGPNTKLDASRGQPRTEAVSPEEKAALDASAPDRPMGVGPRGEDVETGSWVRLSLSGGPVYFLEEQVEGVVQTLPLRWRVGGKPVEPEQLALPPDAAISPRTRGAVLLVTSGDAVRVYDVGQKKHLLSLEGAFLVGFWPRAAPAPVAAGAPGLNLEDPRAALELLEQSTVKLDASDASCGQLAEAGTLGALAKKARAEGAQWSVLCEPRKDTKIWACHARFVQPGGEDFDGPAMILRYEIDEATRTVPPGSLHCQMAG